MNHMIDRASDICKWLTQAFFFCVFQACRRSSFELSQIYLVNRDRASIANMSEEDGVCVTCKECATSKKRLVNNPVMTDELLQRYQEVSLGDTQSDIHWLQNYLSSLNEELRSVRYHSECRKPIVNKAKIERLRKRSRTDSPVCPPREPERPSSAAGSVQPNRSKTIPK